MPPAVLPSSLPSWRRALGAAAVAACAAGAALLPPASADAAVPSRSRSARSARAARAARAARLARRHTARRSVARGSVILRGSKAAVDRAYQAAVEEGLEFAPSRQAIERGAAEGAYVRLPQSTASFRLRGVAVPYVRPETHAFLAAFAPEYRRACGEPLTVTSAMRPTSVHLANSVEKTVHPTGMALDLRAPRNGCIGWMRTALISYERQGVVEATEEHHPAHFHVAVLRAP